MLITQKIRLLLLVGLLQSDKAKCYIIAQPFNTN
jgi:hypothetical protein